MQRFVPIAGTWARSRHDHAQAWYRTGSPFDRRMIRHGYQRVEQDLDPTTPDRGFWSGEVNGLLVQRLAWWRDHHPACAPAVKRCGSSCGAGCTSWAA